jgi:D-glycero-D-manno-heptose 1,7-bisphosphate phosphatase
MAHKAVLLDRDGTINEEVGYLDHPDRFKLLPRVGEAIRLLNRNGIKAVVVTNQSGVARGYFPETMVLKVHQKMADLLKDERAYLDGIYYCPHHPDVGEPPYRQRCGCRKPETGLVDLAIKELNIDCSLSYSVGDRMIDVEFGHRVKAKSILVLTGYGREEWDLKRDRWTVTPDHVAQDLFEAVQWILKQEGVE